MVRLYSFLLDKARIPVRVDVGDGAPVDVPWTASAEVPAAPVAPRDPEPASSPGPTVRAPLSAIAYARSGDKGDLSNVAVMARRPDALALLRAQLTPARVKAWMAHLVDGEVERFDWPGLHGMNFVMHQALGGGGVASLRFDPQGKAHAQILLDMPVDVPRAWLPDSFAPQGE